MKLAGCWLVVLYFLLSTTPVLSQETLSAAEKEQIRAVFDRLIEARGDARRSPPELRWTSGETRGAFYVPGTQFIYFEPATYRVCQSFDGQTEDALAYVLAHELIHYYQQHGWEAGFARYFFSEETPVPESADIQLQEIESDLMGGFLAYTAGYSTIDLAPSLLPELYHRFGWPTESAEGSPYPSLQQRIQFAQTAARQLEDLILVFETANYLLAIDRFAAAHAYYQYVYDRFPSVEIKNNLGVASALEAMQYFPSDSIEFVLPLELDGMARLRSADRGNQSPENVRHLRDSLLFRAADYFREAIYLDSDYTPARLNLGCIHALLALSGKDAPEWWTIHHGFTRSYAFECKRIARQRDLPVLGAHADVLMGILDRIDGEKGKAEAKFRQALPNDLARVNLNLLLGSELPNDHRSRPAGFIPESIDDSPLEVFAMSPQPDTSFALSPGSPYTYGMKQSELPHSTVIFNYEAPNQNAFFHVTGPDYAGTTQGGIALGYDRAALREAYLDPDRIIATPRGAIWVYEKHRLLFELNAAGKIKRWIVFRTQPPTKG